MKMELNKFKVTEVKLGTICIKFFNTTYQLGLIDSF